MIGSRTILLGNKKGLLWGQKVFIGSPCKLSSWRRSTIFDGLDSYHGNYFVSEFTCQLGFFAISN